MQQSVPARLSWRPSEAYVLGLEPDDLDPVAIIVAAQLRLRSHRRQSVAAQLTAPASDDVRRIVAARDKLLRHTVERCRCHDHTAERPTARRAEDVTEAMDLVACR
ncbi:MAG: hypothetical protein RLZZ440_1848 [Planctomycetota bacterium]|jgi:hypothetical protein